jgi:serine/threonine-protein kinase RsbW
MPDSPERCYELEIPAKAQYVSLARLLASSIARSMSFPEEDVDDLKVAVSEMCTNAIVHSGNGTAEKPPILVRYCAGRDYLRVQVSDRGPGFDIGCVLNRERTDLLEKGRGIPLIQCLVDEFQCDSQPGSGTVVTVVKYLRPRESQP